MHEATRAGPNHALESLGVREHARHGIEIPIESFGTAPELAPAHTRWHPPSIAIRGRISMAGHSPRPPNER